MSKPTLDIPLLHRRDSCPTALAPSPQHLSSSAPCARQFDANKDVMAGLPVTEQWEDELHEKFDLDFDLLAGYRTRSSRPPRRQVRVPRPDELPANLLEHGGFSADHELAACRPPRARARLAKCEVADEPLPSSSVSLQCASLADPSGKCPGPLRRVRVRAERAPSAGGGKSL